MFEEVFMRSTFPRQARLTALAAAAFGALAATACKSRANDTDTGRADVSAADTTGTGAMAATGDTAGTATASSKLSDPNIVALLDEANKADSSAGAFALGKAADPQVKAFAKMMMGEHHALRVQGQTLAKKLGVTPQAPANDPVKTAASSEMSALQSAGKGAEFDRTYIDQEVTIHKAVLDLAGQAHDATQTDELKALIEKAKPTIQKHLDRAEELQKSLGKATT
jgi:putative membrane protein